MDMFVAQSRFRALNINDKALLLLRVMYELTLAVRRIFVDYQDSETRARLAYSISELNHRLTSAAEGIIEVSQTYPDDVLVEMLFDGPGQSELEPYFPYVFEEALQYVNRRQAQGS